MNPEMLEDKRRIDTEANRRAKKFKLLSFRWKTATMLQRRRMLKIQDHMLARRLFYLLPHEDRLVLLGEFYKGVKVKHTLRQGERMAWNPMRLIPGSWELEIAVTLDDHTYSVTLAHYEPDAKPSDQQILALITKYLPSVKVL